MKSTFDDEKKKSTIKIEVHIGKYNQVRSKAYCDESECAMPCMKKQLQWVTFQSVSLLLLHSIVIMKRFGLAIE